MLKLFYSPSSCALASHITLEESGADYQAERVDFASGQQREPEYLKINPKGRVPALVTDQGIITETPAVLVYIAQNNPQANLAPLNDAFAFAQMQSINSYLCSTVHVAHAHNRRGYRWVDDENAITAMQAKVTQNMPECFQLIEQEMLKGPWVMGEQYTICDPYLFTIARWLEGDGVDIADLPAIREHRERVGERPAVQTVLARESAAA